MPEDKHLQYRDLRRLLSRFGVYEVKSRGKGSHRLFVHENINGRKISYPIKCHHEGEEIHSFITRKIRRAFNIPYEQFYSK